MKKSNICIKSTLFAAISLASCHLYAGDLTVYTALEPEQLGDLKKGFEAQNPGINIKWVRDSTGVITAKLLAEKARPNADVIWGVAATSLMLLDKEGMLAAYAPKDLDKLDDKFRDARPQPHWVGLDASLGTICFNTIEGKKLNLPEPKSWKDLTNPVYKGKIIMPNPSSSGTGFLNVTGWLQSMGEKEGWAFMDGLHSNIDRYTHSGAAPCKLVASGEAVVGISFDFPSIKLKQQGAPIDVIFPTEGSGWDTEAAAIIANTPKMAEAQKLLDYAITEEASKLYNRSFAVLARPGIAKIPAGYPQDIANQMIKNDFTWSADNRSTILNEWSNRYQSKSEAKK